MNWLDLVFFIVLAFLCNTALPLSFDPVLIFFASRGTSSGAHAFALIGSVCAGLAAIADVRVSKSLQTRQYGRLLATLPSLNGVRFYVLAFLVALSPLPFSIVRMAVLRRPPATVPYALAVGLGRLPRYLLTVSLCSALGFLSRSAAVLLFGMAAFTIIASAFRVPASPSEQIAQVSSVPHQE
jgi:hypothetical protein